MDFKNIKFPKIRVKFLTALSVIFAAVIIVELFTIYKYVAPRENIDETAVGNPIKNQRIDLDLYHDTLDWIAGQKASGNPNYILTGSTAGRVNPFAEN